MIDNVIPVLIFLVPVVAILGTVGIVASIVWYKARSRELQFHQDQRLKEMEHLRRMKELELEIERVKAAQSGPRAA